MCWGTGPGIWDQEDLERGRPGWLCSGIRCCRLLFPKAILTTDFVHKKAVLSLYKMKSDSKCFFSALLIAQIPIWDVFPVNKDNLLSVVLWLKYSDTSSSEGWGFLISSQFSHSSGNASLWIWNELRDIITNGPIIMWRILPWDSSPVLTDTETLWTLWKTNVQERNVICIANFKCTCKLVSIIIEVF